MALRLDDISFAYDAGTPLAHTALEGVSLSLDPGQLAVVLGPTGSGKSTLLRIAAGLLSGGRGQATLDGEPVRGAASARAGGLGLVFQSPETQLFAETVLDDVAFGPRNQGLGEEEALLRARTALETVGLEPEAFGSRSPLALSGGEARRAALAGVLAMRPRYLLLDEPTAGLDAGGRSALMSILATVRASSGLLVVTHDSEQFLADADKVLVLAHGSAVFSGSPEELLEEPEAFVRAGLLPPPAVDTLLRARSAGAHIPRLALDPVAAARFLLAAKGSVR